MTRLRYTLIRKEDLSRWYKWISQKLWYYKRGFRCSLIGDSMVMIADDSDDDDDN